MGYCHILSVNHHINIADRHMVIVIYHHIVVNTCLLFLFIYSSDNIQPSTLIMDQSPSELLLDIKGQKYV